jgi:hypothetical protein
MFKTRRSPCPKPPPEGRAGRPGPGPGGVPAGAAWSAGGAGDWGAAAGGQGGAGGADDWGGADAAGEVPRGSDWGGPKARPEAWRARGTAAGSMLGPDWDEADEAAQPVTPVVAAAWVQIYFSRRSACQASQYHGKDEAEARATAASSSQSWSSASADTV